ncbi:MAG: DNA primase DnaG [Candidatus Altiarchaeota archaeon]|nr:DNA primase DnaG [Candidatus Altiarchaeota archaeon]
MAKAPADTVKYNVYAEIMIDGVVEKPDVVGAIFGQSEGLLGEDLELRDLQKTGRIGRIEVDLKTKSGKSAGTVIVPSSLDMVETSIIASAIENVDRVGPCNAKIHVTNVEDARNAKRKVMVERAKEILKKLMNEQIPESMELTDEVRKSVQLSEITSYKGLPAGPAIESSDSVIIVEGRADVLTLLKAGIKNVVAVGGTNVPKQVVDLSKEKTSIAFVDGDRGGDIILKELGQVTDVDFIARAPYGKEVEDLTKKEIIMCLRRKVPFEQVKGGGAAAAAQRMEQHDREPQPMREREMPVRDEAAPLESRLIEELTAVKGKLTARLFDEGMGGIAEIEIKDLINTLSKVQPAYVVLDGIVTQRLVDSASKSGVKALVGVNKAADITDDRGVRILTDR